MGGCCSTEKEQGGIRLGSNDSVSQPTQQSQMVDREQALMAAEQRRKEKEGKGALGKKLDAQAKIGPGRAVDTSLGNQQSNLTARDFQ